MDKIKYLTYKILFNLTNSEKLSCNPILHVQKNIKKIFPSLYPTKSNSICNDFLKNFQFLFILNSFHRYFNANLREYVKRQKNLFLSNYFIKKIKLI